MSARTPMSTLPMLCPAAGPSVTADSVLKLAKENAAAEAKALRRT